MSEFRQFKNDALNSMAESFSVPVDLLTTNKTEFFDSEGVRDIKELMLNLSSLFGKQIFDCFVAESFRFKYSPYRHMWE